MRVKDMCVDEEEERTNVENREDEEEERRHVSKTGFYGLI